MVSAVRSTASEFVGIACSCPTCRSSDRVRSQDTGSARGVDIRYHVPNDAIPQGGRTARNVEHGREVMVWIETSPGRNSGGFPPAPQSMLVNS